MTARLIVRLCVAGLVVLLLLLSWQALKNQNPGVQLIFFLVVGGAGGVLVVKYFIPWLGDVVGTLVYSSGEEVQMDDSMKAAAKVAQGDYEGAIAEYQKLLRDKPDQCFPIGEIAKIRAEKLGDPQGALDVLRTHLERKEWPVDDAAFLMFRIADIHADLLNDYDAARDMLQQVIASFPNTRHSANAHHKLNEVEQAQFKALTEQRRKADGQAS